MADVSPSDRELDILKVLWRIGESPVRDVHQALCPDGECAFTTIQTLLRIMADKGLVRQKTVGRTSYFKPLYSLEKASSRFLHKIFDGAVDQMMLSMLRSEDLSTTELRELEKLISKARREKQSGGE